MSPNCVKVAQTGCRKVPPPSCATSLWHQWQNLHEGWVSTSPGAYCHCRRFSSWWWWHTHAHTHTVREREIDLFLRVGRYKLVEEKYVLNMTQKRHSEILSQVLEEITLSPRGTDSVCSLKQDQLEDNRMSKWEAVGGCIFTVFCLFGGFFLVGGGVVLFVVVIVHPRKTFNL